MPKVRTTLTVDADVLRAVKVRAARTGKGDSEVIEEALRRDLGLDLLERLWETRPARRRRGRHGCRSSARDPDLTSPEPVRAVMDANVFISALLSREGAPARVLRAWQQGAFELIVFPLRRCRAQRALAYPRLALRPITAGEALQPSVDWLTRSATWLVIRGPRLRCGPPIPARLPAGAGRRSTGRARVRRRSPACPRRPARRSTRRRASCRSSTGRRPDRACLSWPMACGSESLSPLPGP